MQAAWQQVGEIRKVNEALVRMQFGRFVGEALHRSHLARLGLGELAQVLRGVQDKIRPGGAALDRLRHGGSQRGAGRRDERRVPPRHAGARAARPCRATARRDCVRQMVAANGEASRTCAGLCRARRGARLFERAIAAIPPALLAEKLGVPMKRVPRAT